VVTRVLIAAAVIVLASLASLVLRRRTSGTDAPTQAQHHVPTQLDRSDFASPDTPWLVAVFSSATCQTCANVVSKASVLHSASVAVDDVEYAARRALHEKYRIDGVPCVVIADRLGVVHRSFLGPVTATDLWAAVADARDPEARAEHLCDHDHAHTPPSV
jgi:hypothetical protein